MSNQTPDPSPRPTSDAPLEPGSAKARQPKRRSCRPRSKPRGKRPGKGAERARKFCRKAIRASERASRDNEDLVRRARRARHKLRRRLRRSPSEADARLLRQVDSELASILHAASLGRKRGNRLSLLLDEVFEALGDSPRDAPAPPAPQAEALPEIGSFLRVPLSQRGNAGKAKRLFVLDGTRVWLPPKLAKVLVALAVDHGSSPDHLVGFKDRDSLAGVLETSPGNVNNLVHRLRHALSGQRPNLGSLVETNPAGGGYRLRLRRSHWIR